MPVGPLEMPRTGPAVLFLKLLLWIVRLAVVLVVFPEMLTVRLASLLQRLIAGPVVLTETQIVRLDGRLGPRFVRLADRLDLDLEVEDFVDEAVEQV